MVRNTVDPQAEAWIEDFVSRPRNEQLLSLYLDSPSSKHFGLLFLGRPGEGKTSTIRAFAERRGSLCEVLVASHQERGDLIGLPVAPNDAAQGVFVVPPAWLKRLNDAAATCEPGREPILFIDELTLAGSDVMSVLLSLISERIVGAHKLDERVRIVAAANPTSMLLDAMPLPVTMRNRLLIAEWRHSVDDEYDRWIDLARDGFTEYQPVAPRPASVETQGDEIVQRLFSVLQYDHALIGMDSYDGLADESPFPSPRAWTNAAMLLRDIPKCGANIEESLIRTILKGFVGEHAGNQMAAAISYHIDVPRIFADPVGGFEWADRNGRARSDRVFSAFFMAYRFAATRNDARYNPVTFIDVVEKVARAHEGTRMIAWTFYAKVYDEFPAVVTEIKPKTAQFFADIKQGNL